MLNTRSLGSGAVIALCGTPDGEEGRVGDIAGSARRGDAWGGSQGVWRQQLCSVFSVLPKDRQVRALQEESWWEVWSTIFVLPVLVVRHFLVLLLRQDCPASYDVGRPVRCRTDPRLSRIQYAPVTSSFDVAYSHEFLAWRE